MPSHVRPKPTSKPSKPSKPTTSTATEITDPRFASLQSDPRYRPPPKRHVQIKVDKRFSHMLQDEDFVRKAKVDRWGRQLEGDSERKRLKRKYRFDDDGEEDGADDDEDVQKELKRVSEGRDAIRGIGHEDGSEGADSSSSSDEDEDEEEIEEDEEEIGQTDRDGGVPMGDVSTRIAVVNLDWDHIRAEDLMAVFSSFVPAGGRLNKVVVYPSEFGRERMEREEMEGPPKELFASGSHDEDMDEDEELDAEEDEEDAIRKSIIKPDTGEEFNSAKLRKYQLERLRYYYAVLTFSSTDAAKAVYDAVDGTEYLSTANFFDLRFIPDGTDFSEDKPRDECDSIPDSYKPNEFVTDALQHSKVKLTWDADDSVRKEAQAKAFRGSRKDIDENDLKAYLGSDSSDEDEIAAADASEVQQDSKESKKEKEKQRLRALLGLGEAPAKKSKSDGPVGDVQITFSSGLTGGDKKTSIFANDPEPEETTAEKYIRKERERKQRRKEKQKTGGGDVEVPEAATVEKAEEDRVAEDLGFDDPFFTAPENDKASTAALRKQERKKKREERAREEEATAAKRAELELLMIDDKQANVKHFNMNDIERAEKKKRKGKKSKKSAMEDGIEGDPAANDSFKMDVADPRFAQLFENHEFAIDPTNSKYKGTGGMKALLEEGRKRRKFDSADGEGVSSKKNKTSQTLTTKAGKEGGANDDYRKLIRSVKARSKGAQ